MLKVNFNNSNPEFFKTLKKRVDEYFKTNQKKKTGNIHIYLKTAVLLTVLISCYLFLFVFKVENIYLQFLIAGILGFDMGLIGFNLMHDAAHGSYSNKKWINDIMSWSLNLLGGSVVMWKQKHNVNHHSFTNIEGVDDDIDIKPFIRVHEGQDKKSFHRFQHLYFIFLYSSTYLFWIFVQDFRKYFSGKVAEHVVLKKMTISEHIFFWITKLLHVTLFIVLPVFAVGLGKAIALYLVAAAVCGILIAIVFQLAHIVEDTDFVHTNENTLNIENEWAIHQIYTTVNFATKNKITSWMLGGLNFQVEHHLFPYISHVHYPKVNKILKETCQEFNVTYREFPNTLKAFISHFRHLRNLAIN